MSIRRRFCVWRFSDQQRSDAISPRQLLLHYRAVGLVQISLYKAGSYSSNPVIP